MLTGKATGLRQGPIKFIVRVIGKIPGVDMYGYQAAGKKYCCWSLINGEPALPVLFYLKEFRLV